MPRKHKDNQPPAMTSTAPMMPIYDYTVHLRTGIHRMPERPAPAVTSHLDHGGRGSDLCAIGSCPGCGRTIISAVHPSKATLRLMCGLCGD
jgi:hypothetical protein